MSRKALDPVTTSAQYGYLPCFDGLRALAIVLVVLRHFEVSSRLPGGFGVSVFFFISGALITRLLIAEHESKGRIDLLNFYTRRFVRLMPPLVLMLALTGIALLWTGYRIPPMAFCSSLLYFRNYYIWWRKIHGYPFETALWEPTWSLAVEEHFYLLFPIMLLAVGIRSKYGAAALAAPCVASLLLRILYWFVLPLPDQYCYHATEARLDAILTGCLLSYVAHRHSRSTFWKPISQRWVFYFCAALLPLTMLIREPFYDAAIKYTVQQVLLFVAVYHLLFVDAHRWLKAILELPVLRYLGRLSYSIYLWHLPCRYAVLEVLGPDSVTLTIVAATGLSLVAAACSYHLLEMPLVDLRKRFGAHVPVQTSQAESKNPHFHAGSSARTRPRTDTHRDVPVST